MKRAVYLPENILALTGNSLFMSKIWELLDSNFDAVNVDRICRELVRYYFNLNENKDSSKINAIVHAVNVIAIKPTEDVQSIQLAEDELINAFNSDDPSNFKEAIKKIPENINEKKRPYIIPKLSAPQLPTLPELAKTPKPVSEQLERPKEPTRIPYLAKYTKEQSKHLQAIRDIRVDGKYDASKALEFFSSQKGSATEANRGFQKAITALDIRPALDHLDKLAARAIKTGNQEAVRNVAGYVNEMKDLISKKKSELEEGKERYSVPQLQVAQVTIQILERTEQKIEKVSQECKMSLNRSDRTSRG